MRKFLEPIPLRLCTIVGTIVWIWLSMAGMDYRLGGASPGLTTSGMFIVGLPFIIVVAIFTSMIAALIHRRSAKFGWLATVATFGILISTTYVGSLPKNRLVSIIKIDAENVEIVRMRQADSFNDGITTVAVISADTDTFDRLLADNKLESQSKTLPFWLNWFEDHESILDRHTEVTVFDSDKLTCYHDQESKEIHIYHRSRSLPEE